MGRGLSAVHKDEARLQQKQRQNGLRHAWLPFAALSMWAVAVGRRGSREEGHRRRWRKRKKKRKEGGSENIVTRCRVTPATPGPVSRIKPRRLTEGVTSKEVLKGRPRGCWRRHWLIGARHLGVALHKSGRCGVMNAARFPASVTSLRPLV